MQVASTKNQRMCPNDDRNVTSDHSHNKVMRLSQLLKGAVGATLCQNEAEV